MPIHIDVYVNAKSVKSYHIGRLEGDSDPESVNTYVVTETQDGGSPRWDLGTKFEHRFGDGIDICIAKGMQAFIAPIDDGLHLTDADGGLCLFCRKVAFLRNGEWFCNHDSKL
jgi:hypothetical protein